MLTTNILILSPVFLRDTLSTTTTSQPAKPITLFSISSEPSSQKYC